MQTERPLRYDWIIACCHDNDWPIATEDRVAESATGRAGPLTLLLLLLIDASPLWHHMCGMIICLALRRVRSTWPSWTAHRCPSRWACGS